MLYTAPTLPEACSTLPPRCKKFLIELVHVARAVAVRRGQPNVAQVQFHVPQWLLAESFGVHESTLRNWFKRPELRHVVAATVHYQDGFYHRLKTGMLLAVVLNPQEHTRARLAFERGVVLRDLQQDAELGRVRGSYFPRGKSFIERVLNWLFVNPEEEQVPVDDARDLEEAVDNPDTVLHCARTVKGYRLTAQAIAAAADTIIRLLGDSQSYRLAWMKLLYNLRRRPERDFYVFHATLQRYRTAHSEGLKTAAPQLMRVCREAGWL